MGKIHIKITAQWSHTRFLEKYGGLSLYDEDLKKGYKIDNGGINFVKNYGLDWILNTNEPDGTSTDHEYLPIHNNLLGRILAKNNNVGISSKINYNCFFKNSLWKY